MPNGGMPLPGFTCCPSVMKRARLARVIGSVAAAMKRRAPTWLRSGPIVPAAGVPREEAEGHIAQVASPEAEVVQRRTIKAGETVTATRLSPPRGLSGVPTSIRIGPKVE